MLNYQEQREVDAFLYVYSIVFEKNGGEGGDSLEIGASFWPLGIDGPG
jgi:hypothetical protein